VTLQEALERINDILILMSEPGVTPQKIKELWDEAGEYVDIVLQHMTAEALYYTPPAGSA